ncbi:MAG TPA: 30S ribosomal protein S3 [Thermoanaerobaculia bacterium]|nr:30S ribosomal protein S3 [Thermoanaerobaculia bacterium]HUM30644.1 30S ribosomal protein S3 [Thermoanaerobaculia bacterium]HXK68948.1 30S ribosomal protein S3 [Thermoanaerobaculia bacterium]
MGQKTHPYGFRIGYNKPWRSRWYEWRDYSKFFHEDLQLRKALKKRLSHASVSDIEIERTGNQVKIDILTARPGIIIGKKGAEVDKLRDELQKRLDRPVYINIQEIQRPEIEAQLVAENIANRLERRVAYRRAMKRAIESSFRFGALGVKIKVGGRLNGAEIARDVWYQEGRLPLQTLKANIDYGFAEANTTYGVIGVKVWIYKGDQYKQKFRRI